MVEGQHVGAYRVLHRIGEGGMGSVWLAEHTALGRRAAIKVLHPEFSHRPEIVTRFFNEAKAATAINDPGIVQIFDFGQNVDGSVYIVMELLEGEPLDQRLARIGTFALPDALRIMRQVASTLGAAHTHRIVHRDLKPENVFLVRDPEVASGERAKVLDFGIAKLAGETGGVKTQTSAVMGTPLYMSPEQCRGAGLVDQRSDVYSLGCMLYALLVGHPPFVAEGAGELIVMHLREPPLPPSKLRPGLPPEIDQLVLRCLAKDPEQRFTTGAELAIALGALHGSSPSHTGVSRSSLELSRPTPATAPTTLSSAAGETAVVPSSARGRRGWLIGLAAVALVGGGTAAFFLRGRDTSHPARTAAPTPTPAPVERVVVDAAVIPPPPDPTAEVPAAMIAVVDAFAGWATDHAGAPCPDVAALAGAPADPWGHAFRLTCTDQPGDQIVGVLSAGPDGTFGNADDIASWQLGRDVTDRVQGARWAVAVAPPVTPPKAKPGKPGKKPGKRGNGSGTTTSSGVQLDENGLPISR